MVSMVFLSSLHTKTKQDQTNPLGAAEFDYLAFQESLNAD